MVEPSRDAATGQVLVAGLHRQPMTKTGAARTIALPGAAAEMLNRRRDRMTGQYERQPGLRLGERRVVVAERHADQAARRGRGTPPGRSQPPHATSQGGHIGRSQRGTGRRPRSPRPPRPFGHPRHYVAEMGRLAGLLATSVGLVLVGAARKCYLHDAVILLLITESDLSAHEREPAIGCALSGGVG